MIIRRANVGDAEFVAELERECIDCPWTIAQIKAEIDNPDCVFFVAEELGVPVGYVSGIVTCDECEMSNIAVASNRRQSGVGRMLMAELLAELERRSVGTTFLLVRDDNAAAIALYEKTGFVGVGIRKGYYSGKNALIMRLNIV